MMRAKMRVHSVLDTEYGDEVKMNPVCGALDQDGHSEDNSYARYTPSGEITLTVNNPALKGKIRAGQQYYVDFSIVPDDCKD